MKKIRHFALITLLSLYILPVFTQNVLLHKEIKDSVKLTYGPNLKNYAHFYMAFGFIAGQPESAGSDISYGNSTHVMIGYRYKLKLTNWYALGCDIAFSSYSYRLKQSLAKITPDTILHGKERLSLGSIGADAYMRFNAGRRGNRIGNFIDFGAYGDWIASARNYTKDKMPNGNIVETTISHLTYFNSYEYGVLARLGFNRYVIYGLYRVSDLFRSSSQYPELPRITVGLQIGLHK